jgi:poly-gamma-glutamate synthesis protein (capsule biosynthesis protein)
MLDRHVKEKMKNNDPAYLFQGLKNGKFDFNKYDLAHGNLEGAVTDGGDHYPPLYSYDFAFAPEAVARLKNYNFKAFNLANNHLTDQGEGGAAETRANLAKLNFLSYGCSDAQAGDCSFKIYQAGGLKIGLAGFSQVYKKLDPAEAKKIIEDLSARTDLVIVNMHWGVEYEHIFNKTQQDLAHKLIEAGADLIIGHHPHVVQGLEIYQNKLIFYSLGNFIFDQYFSRDTQEELAVEVAYEAGGQVKIVLYPLISRQSQPSLMIGKEKEKYLEKIAGWSKGDVKLLKQIKAGEIAVNF